MRLPRQTSLNFLLLLPLSFAAQKVCGQLAPAGDFFNSGAQAYISNNIPAALERVEMGLKTYPDDEKLKKLEELLKQQQQNQQDQQKQNDQQKKSGDQKNQQQNQSQQQNDRQSQQKQDEQKQNQANQKKDEQQKQQEQQNASADKKDGDQKDQQQSGQPAKPGEMTPEEAKRLLDAQKGNEQLLQLKPDTKPRNNQRPVRDW
jgi:site-specific DNA-cytosine methylase